MAGPYGHPPEPPEVLNMGRRGPAQQSADVKIAKGTFQKHHHKETLPVGNKQRPRNPFATKRLAWRAFEQMVKELQRLGTIDTADLSHLVAYAEAFETRELAQKVLLKEGHVLKDHNEKLYRHPMSIVWADATAKLRTLGNDLGTNANARSRTVPQDAKPKQRVAKSDFFA